jgi:hypothetical protein
MISYFGGRGGACHEASSSEAEMIAALKQVEAGDVLVHLGIREILLRHMSPKPVSGQCGKPNAVRSISSGSR